MSTHNEEIEGKPIIKADLGDNGGIVAFHALEEAKKWVEGEIKIWDGYEFQGIRSDAAPYILERQLRLPRAISQSLENAAVMQGDELLAALESIKDQFEQYAEYSSINSASQIGKEIFAMIGDKKPFLAMGSLASNLGIPANDLLRGWYSKESELGVILAGYALCHTSNTIRRSDLPEHKYRMEIHLKNLDDIVKQAGDDQDRIKGVAMSTIEKSSQALKKEETDWGTFTGSAQREWEALRNTFETQLRLKSPVKYWQELADTTSRVANRSLFWFLASATVIIGVVIVFGPDFLEYVSASNNIGPFTTMAFVSVPALTALWGLKHVARLFVTNMERSADARLRETMTTTFLALAKEGAATIDQQERLLILEALFRRPTPAPSDDGHWSGLSSLLSRRSS